MRMFKVIFYYYFGVLGSNADQVWLCRTSSSIIITASMQKGTAFWPDDSCDDSIAVKCYSDVKASLMTCFDNKLLFIRILLFLNVIQLINDLHVLLSNIVRD